jgi:hypothetical protein
MCREQGGGWVFKRRVPYSAIFACEKVYLKNMKIKIAPVISMNAVI